ncbi:MAG: SgcJ/EcaC family oxidoreductase, partial [Planctomycetota bacterium]|nr:SgcJ/EcaC family oxidoreductase [Planctomycetota bacterium]
MTRYIGCVMGQLLVGAWMAMPAAGVEGDATRTAIEQASAAYAEAYNARNYEALADQWVEQAELIEGGASVTGRNEIVKSIRGWLDKHAEAKIEIQVERVALVAKSLARVDGMILFSSSANEPPIPSRFSSLRVLEDGAWRLVESVVAPSHAAALHDLGWLIGSWQAVDDKTGMTVDLVVEKAAGGFALVGRTTMRSKTGATREAIE